MPHSKPSPQAGAIIDARPIGECLREAAPSAAEAVERHLLTSAQAAHALGCTADTVDSLLRCGKLPGIKIGRSWRLPKDALLEHLNAMALDNLREREPARPVAVVLGNRMKKRVPPVLPDLGGYVFGQG